MKINHINVLQNHLTFHRVDRLCIDGTVPYALSFTLKPVAISSLAFVKERIALIADGVIRQSKDEA